MRHVEQQPYLSQEMAPPDEPAKVPEIDDALDEWLEAKVEQKRAGDTTKIRHAKLLELLDEHGLDGYPYIDRTTGKKKRVYPDRTPKLKTGSEPRSRDRDEEPGEEVTAPDDDGKVETRRVSRKSVEDEIDPFAATRSKMAGGILDQAEKKLAGEDRDVTITIGDETTSLATGKKTKAKKRGKSKR